MSVYDPAYQTFLRRLRQARLDAGMTQIRAASLLNKAKSYPSKCELGERRVDFVETLRFARLYKKPISYFTRGLLGL